MYSFSSGFTKTSRTAVWAARSSFGEITGCSSSNGDSNFSFPNSSTSSREVRYPSRTFMKKRSSCASGSGKVPEYSTGFWVAITMKGDGSSLVSPSIVTWRSSIASSRADCVLGVARLISSASRICAKTGPGRNSKSPSFWLKARTPVMSEGSRSGVNWMRRNVQSRDRATAFASIVLPTPGTSSMRRCPPQSRVMRHSRTSSSLWTMARATFASTGSTTLRTTSSEASSAPSLIPTSVPATGLYGRPWRASRNESHASIRLTLVGQSARVARGQLSPLGRASLTGGRRYVDDIESLLRAYRRAHRSDRSFRIRVDLQRFARSSHPQAWRCERPGPGLRPGWGSRAGGIGPGWDHRQADWHPHRRACAAHADQIHGAPGGRRLRHRQEVQHQRRRAPLVQSGEIDQDRSGAHRRRARGTTRLRRGGACEGQRHHSGDRGRLQGGPAGDRRLQLPARPQ